MTPSKETRRAEGRGQPGRNPGEGNRVRTQSRVALPSNLARVNAAARMAVRTRFTALLHHVDIAAAPAAAGKRGNRRGDGGDVRTGPGAQSPGSVRAHSHRALPAAAGAARLHPQ